MSELRIVGDYKYYHHCDFDATSPVDESNPLLPVLVRCGTNICGFGIAFTDVFKMWYCVVTNAAPKSAANLIVIPHDGLYYCLFPYSLSDMSKYDFSADGKKYQLVRLGAKIMLGIMYEQEPKAKAISYAAATRVASAPMSVSTLVSTPTPAPAPVKPRLSQSLLDEVNKVRGDSSYMKIPVLARNSKKVSNITLHTPGVQSNRDCTGGVRCDNISCTDHDFSERIEILNYIVNSNPAPSDFNYQLKNAAKILLGAYRMYGKGKEVNWREVMYEAACSISDGPAFKIIQ